MKAPAQYPRSDRRYGERPIRLLDTSTNTCIPHRCYKFPVRALNQAAAYVTNWAAVGTAIDVYNAQSGRLIGSYKRKADGTVYVWIDHKWVQANAKGV